VLGLRCTSVTLNTKKQAIDAHVQISQSNNHVFICLSSPMTSNQSSKFNKILKDNKDACEYSINQRHHCQTIFFFSFSQFSDFFFIIYINESKWFLNYQQEQHKVHHKIKQTINTPPNLKLTLSSMFKQMYVRTRYKSLNESTREKERKYLIL
jgi:hypothetical protein